MTTATIIDARAYEYVMPFRKGFGTARGISTRAQNTVVVLTAEVGAERVVGLGESAPRGPDVTGDLTAGSWEFLRAALDTLLGHHISLAERERSLDDVRAEMAALFELADRHAAGAVPRPFRGLLSGIDMALVDLAARCHSLPISELLGRRRDQPPISAATINTARTPEQVDDEATRHLSRFPMVRVKTFGEIDRDLARIGRITEIGRSIGVSKPIWADFNGALSVDDASVLVDRLAADMRRGRLPSHMIIEQPVAKDERAALPQLQAQADQALARPRWRRRKLRISLMADESVWDRADAEALHAGGGCAALNIKIQKVGGVLAAFDLANVAHALDPDTELYIGGMIGTSDITGWSLTNLLMALPRVDYNTTVPHGNVERRIAEPPMRYVSKTTNRLVERQDVGHGTQLAAAHLIPYVTREMRLPTPTAPRLDELNRFEIGLLDRFSKLELDSHLLEAEALARKMHTERVSSKMFFAHVDSRTSRVGFHWSTSSHTARTAFMLAGNKQATRAIMQRADVAYPAGRRFPIGDIAAAGDFAEQLGWPVVVKPTTGGGGSGVTTGITSRSELEWAVASIDHSKYRDFVVEAHVEGNDYRFLVIGDEVISVIFRVPAHVVGDGVSTITDLIIRKNIVRRANPHLAARLIAPGERTLFQLERQGLTLESVPSPGERVWLSTAGNISQGGDSYEVIDEVHPSLLDMAVRAVRAVPGLPAGGVDFLIEDHRKPLDQQSAAICEVNSSPATTSHHFPMVGRPKNASEALLLHTCSLSDVVLGPRHDTVAIDVVVEGHVQGVGYRAWLRRLALDAGISGWVRNSAAAEQVEACLAGPTGAVAALASLCITGPKNSRPGIVRTSPHEGPVPTGAFEVGT